MLIEGDQAIASHIADPGKYAAMISALISPGLGHTTTAIDNVWENTLD